MPSNASRKYLKTHNLILLLPLALAITNGCGTYPGVMSGNWLITLTPSVSLNQVLAAASFRQSGTQITGTVIFTGANISCKADTSVSGTLQGTSLDLLFVQSQSTANLTGTVNMAFTSGSGAYTIAGNSCFDALGPGVWSAVFISN
jgi:hypothetical protein